MKIITMSGKAEAGKSYTANIIKNYYEDHGISVAIINFAWVLKHLAHDFYDWDGTKSEVGRSILQNLGNAIREKDKNFFVNSTINIIKALSWDFDVFIIDDTRYLNEINTIKEQFECTTVKVIRDGHINSLTDAQKKHSSETELDDYMFDVYLQNNSEDNYKNYVLELIQGDEFYSKK